MFGCLVIGFTSTTSLAENLPSVRIKNESRDTATVSLTVPGEVRHHAFALTKPDRVVVDIMNLTHKFDVPVVQGAGLVTGARVGRPSSSTQRLVLDVAKPSSFNVRISHEGKETSLHVTLQRHDHAVAPTSTQSSSTWVQKAPTPLPTKPLKPGRAVKTAAVPPKALRDVIIVLDPGHGGHDPGAIGQGAGHVEKHVVLAIAKALKRFIDQQPGMHAVLTRDGDYYIGLRERLMLARKYNADVFISIHADAFINTQSHGASVFALSQRGATSEAARWLAEKENYSELGGVNLKHLDDKNGLIRTVLLDLSQTATISSSLQLGGHVLHHLDDITTLHHAHVEQARFVVLKSPDTPSILVETGFISNPVEARNLTNPGYQTRLAQAIFTGLKRYFWSYPPHGTRLEAMSNAQHPALSSRAQRAMDRAA